MEYIISESMYQILKRHGRIPVEGELTRCRDCKWFRANATPHDPDGRYNFCTQFGFDFKGSNGFCAWGER